MTPIETQTLSQRLTGGKLPVPEALRLAMSLAEELRKIHDAGRAHGALTPACVVVRASGLELLAADYIAREAAPYAAPEVLRGRPADARADIYSFGAIVHHMVTGRPPFEGSTAESLLGNIAGSPAPSTGNRSLDALLANCLAAEAAARWQRIQKAQMELKLLSVSARRAETPVHRDNAALIRAEVQQAVTARVSSRLDAQDRTIADFQQAVTASLQAVQAHLCTIDAKLTAAQESAKRSEEGVAKLNLRISSIEEHSSAPSDRLANAELLLQAATERMARVEHATESVRQQGAGFAESAALQLHALDQTVRSQPEALESARTALAETDDLVERVVEALDSLQSIVLERSEDRSPAVHEG